MLGIVINVAQTFDVVRECSVLVLRNRGLDAGSFFFFLLFFSFRRASLRLLKMAEFVDWNKAHAIYGNVPILVYL